MSKNPVYSLDYFFSSHPSCLDSIVNTLYLNPDTFDLLKTINSQVGKISIEIIAHQKEKALWNWNEKKIKLNASFVSSSRENKIAFLIFEFYNASHTCNFIKLIKNAKNVEDFVKHFEKIEYLSALKTKKVAITILGRCTEFDFKYVYQDFSLHYALQQISGHSEWIARQYFPSKNYRGTLYHPLDKLDIKARKCLYSLLYYYLRDGEKDNKNNSGNTNFDTVFETIKKRSSENPICKKVLECAIPLFPKKTSELEEKPQCIIL